MRSSSTAVVGGLAVLPVLIVLTLAMSFDSPVVLAQAPPTGPERQRGQEGAAARQPEVVGLDAGAHASAPSPTPIPRVDPNTIKKSGPARAGRSATGNARDAGRAMPGFRAMSAAYR